MPRRRINNDPFGFGNIGQSFRLANSRMQGRLGEERFRLEMWSQGREVRKIHKGGDFVEEHHTDMFGNRTRRRSKPIVYEIKTGDSKLSEAQERKKRQLGRRYRVVRY